MRVVAVVEVKSVFTDNPERLWRSTKESAGITKQFYNQYFEGRKKAHAIELGAVTVLRAPRSLESICPSIVAPQSYRFVDASLLSAILA